MLPAYAGIIADAVLPAGTRVCAADSLQGTVLTQQGCPSAAAEPCWAAQGHSTRFNHLKPAWSRIPLSPYRVNHRRAGEQAELFYKGYQGIWRLTEVNKLSLITPIN